MCLYGRCPAIDQFYLAVCEYCGQVIKPQALARHIESRHKKIPNHNNSEETNSIIRNNSISYLSQGFNIAETNSVPNHSISDCDKNFNIASQFNSNNSNKSFNYANIKKSSNRGKLLPCKDREYDPDKHCGVKTSEMEKPCTRSLTCKTHSLTLRRAVPDRSKNFDELLLEHKAAKEAALRNARYDVAKGAEKQKQHHTNTQHHHNHHFQHHHQYQNHQSNQRQQQLNSKDQEIKRHLLNTEKVVKYGTKLNNQINEVTENENQSAPMSKIVNNNSWNESREEMNLEGSNHVSSPESYSFIACEGSLYLPNHPKPLALCTFNARQLSLSSFNCDYDENHHFDVSSRLFNRKRDLTYYALTLFKDKLKRNKIKA